MSKVIDQAHGDNFTLYNGDCVEVARGLPDNSIHQIIYSPHSKVCIPSPTIRAT